MLISSENLDALYAETLQLIRDISIIPAPSHKEDARAEFCANWFRKNGFDHVTIDGALNVLAPVQINENERFAVMTAHTDTVFPDTTPMPVLEDETFIHSPGVTDDTANLAVLMICAREFRKHGGRGVLFAANSCEEGLGNLKGVRAIADAFGSRITELVSLDAPSMDHMVTHAVGSHRYRISCKTVGGHSFSNFGNRNAIHVLAQLVTKLYEIEIPPQGKTTFNVGTISGGTSVNTIAQSAEMLFEYRSDDRTSLEYMKQQFAAAVELFRTPDAEIEVKMVGDRPCSAEIPADAFEDLKKRIRTSVKDVLGFTECPEIPGSTDCNVPLSLGIPAACFGVCRGSGPHTREEKLEKASIADGLRFCADFLERSYL